MKKEQLLKKYWTDVLKQDAIALEQYFEKNAYVNWHNTNEHFTVHEFIRANCEYPYSWNGKIERFELIDNLAICVCHVYTSDKKLSFHVTSFIKFSKHDKIINIEEYWGDDGEAPQWRKDKDIGLPIH